MAKPSLRKLSFNRREKKGTKWTRQARSKDDLLDDLRPLEIVLHAEGSSAQTDASDPRSSQRSSQTESANDAAQLACCRKDIRAISPVYSCYREATASEVSQVVAAPILREVSQFMDERSANSC